MGKETKFGACQTNAKAATAWTMAFIVLVYLVLIVTDHLHYHQLFSTGKNQPRHRGMIHSCLVQLNKYAQQKLEEQLSRVHQVNKTHVGIDVLVFVMLGELQLMSVFTEMMIRVALHVDKK